MRIVRSLSLAGGFALLLGLSTKGSAQTGISPAAAFRAARLLYDTPGERGLQGFQCEVAFNWKQFLEKAISGPVEENNERLAYLRTIKLSVSDDLNGAGGLAWTAPTTAPDADEANITQLRSSLQALWSAFFQSWNGFATGGLVSVADNKTTVERTPDGYHVFSAEGGKVAEETFRGDFTLQSLHVSTPQLDSVLRPSFEMTPHGRLVTGWGSVVKQPPAAPGITINTAIHYAAVNGFQLPSQVVIDVADTAAFDFALSNCTVRMR